MIRRIISLILIAVLLANQAMLCCAHAHCGIGVREPSARPHVHLFGHGHHHGCCQHHHDGCHDHHHHCEGHHHDDSNRHDQSSTDVLINPASDNAIELLELDLTGHEHDAVYISNLVDLYFSADRLEIMQSSTVAMDWPFVDRVDILCAVVVRQKSIPKGVPLGLFSAAHCAIFLQTARLLI